MQDILTITAVLWTNVEGRGIAQPTPLMFARCASVSQERSVDNLTKREQPDRSKINMSEDFEIKYWT
jgi:Protein of unknown function (DUF3606)